MNILLMNLFIVYIGSIFARINLNKNNELVSDYKQYNYVFIFIILVSLICVSGFRYYSGTDYGTYRLIYNNTPNIKLNEESEWGFFLLNKVLYRISTNPQIMFLVVAIITNILIVYGILKYSSNFELSMYLYITTFSYYSTFNGMRQWIASAILFVGFRYIIERNFKKYLICVFLAYIFHNSSFIMIPFYFIVNRKFVSKETIFIIISFILACIFYNNFLEQLFNFLQGTRYQHYQETMQDWQEGASILRVFVYSVPLISTLIFRKYMINTEQKSLDIILNLCLMSCLFMLLGTKHVFFVRMNLLFDIYYVILLPKLTQLNNKKLNRIMYYCIAIGYFAYSYALLVARDANIIPYSMNFNIF